MAFEAHPKLPPQSVYVDPRTFATLGPQNPIFRNSAFTQFFNPTRNKPPFFQVINLKFLDILGDNPSIHEVASNPDFAFAHEAPIYNPETDEVFFASNAGGHLGNSDLSRNNRVSKISMRDVETALQQFKPGESGVANVPVTKVDLPDTVQMTNGGTGPLKGSLVFITSGRGPLPPSIALVDPKEPQKTKIILDNFFGRQFNSLNDIKIHPVSGALFFTDPIYGYLNLFRAAPLMPTQVYRFDPGTATIRCVATGFDKCNGIAFTPDGKIAYITDTGALGGSAGNDQTAPATIFAFDVDPKSQAFLNRRVFAYIDTGGPDGIQVDAAGNVYSGCGDGVHVWNSSGTLLGKFFLQTTSANFVFAGDGRLVILAETKIFVAKIASKQGKVEFP